MAYNPQNPNSQATSANSSPVVLSTEQEAKIDLLATKAKQDLLLAELQLKADLTETQPVSIATIPSHPVTNAGTFATQTSGTVFIFSSLNSTVAQLANLATFVGAVESVISQQSYSTLFFSDQNATITILQYIDAAGTKLISSLTFQYLANATFARSGVLNGNYIKVTVQNTGASTTTTLQLDSAFGTIPSATQLNNSPISIQELNGTVLDTNSGNKSAGTQRFVLATDQPNLTTPLNVSIATNPAEGIISTANSSIVTLAANGVFTGTSEDVTNYSSITLSLISDVASATDGLQMQQSINGTNWDLLDLYSIPAATGKTFGAHISAKFFRVVYTNGATIQASFRLQTIFHKFQQPTSTTRPQDTRSNENDLSEVLSYLMGYNGTTWDRLRSSITNGLQVDVVRMPSPAITYSAVANGIVPATAATDLVTIYGSATKTINVLNVWVTGVQTTAGQAQILLIKRSTANTAGTSTAQTRIPYDSNDVAATATVLAYTANPTLGTAIGNVRGDRAFLPGAASASDAQGLTWSFMNGKTMILRGVSQGIAINLNAATLAGGSINVTIEWTEV